MLKILPASRRNQKYRYAIDARGVNHRLINCFELFQSAVFVFSLICSSRKWLPENLVKKVAKFVRKAFDKRKLMRLCHLIFYFDIDLSVEENCEKIKRAWESLFDYGHKSRYLRSSSRSADFTSLLSFNCSNSGVFHCHCFLALPPELFVSPFRFVEYFESKGISVHVAVSEETGEEANEVVNVEDAFKWVLYLAKDEGQDCFPVGFETMRVRKGKLRKLPEAKKGTSRASESVVVGKDESTNVEETKTQEKPQETQEKVKFVQASKQQILENPSESRFVPLSVPQRTDDRSNLKFPDVLKSESSFSKEFQRYRQVESYQSRLRPLWSRSSVVLST